MQILLILLFFAILLRVARSQKVSLLREKSQHVMLAFCYAERGLYFETF